MESLKNHHRRISTVSENRGSRKRSGLWAPVLAGSAVAFCLVTATFEHPAGTNFAHIALNAQLHAGNGATTGAFKRGAPGNGENVPVYAKRNSGTDEIGGTGKDRRGWSASSASGHLSAGALTKSTVLAPGALTGPARFQFRADPPAGTLSVTPVATPVAALTEDVTSSGTSSTSISAVGAAVVHAGYLGGPKSLNVPVAPQHGGDLMVATVVNDSFPAAVTSLSGGGVGNWLAASAPVFDTNDGQVLQIWYGTVTADTTVLTVNWSAGINNADVTEQEFTAGTSASWALQTAGSSSTPFPALTAGHSGELYVGAAMAWGNAAAGSTAGVTYSVPTENFVYATDTDVSGTIAPSATGAGSVAALFSSTALSDPGGVGATTTTAGTPTTATTTSTTAPKSTTTTAVTTTTVPTASASGTVGSMWPSSMFNSVVTSWGLDGNSSTFAKDFVNDYQTHYGTVGVNNMPIYGVPANQAEATVSVRSGCNNFTSDTGTQVPIPPYAALNGSTDNPLVIYQASTQKEWELWQVSRNSNTSYSACWGGELDMGSSNGVFPPNYGLSATGISYLATTITEADVASGSIDHAIAVILPRCNYFVAPADRGDCGSDPGQPAEGQWFRFAPGTAMPSGLTPFAQMVFKAISKYGMVVVDQGGAVMLEAEQTSDWAAEGHSGTDPITASWDGLQEYQVVASLPWSSLQVVVP